ncbi:TetR-like C-terminal domain-containing protein [Micromonospora sp. NPDC023814]|uniref:TetR-like C-terminal domain-containing protein n=1 Tax=Micromonospora sp. NPDC023814 TaxID=3154596 RepID=UPI00340E4473
MAAPTKTGGGGFAGSSSACSPTASGATTSPRRCGSGACVPASTPSPDVVERGIARGDLPSDTSPATARDLLAGPLGCRRLVDGTLTGTDVRELVDTAWKALTGPDDPAVGT